jgi:hypothetical protein
MQEETTNTAEEQASSNDSTSFAEALGILGAFGDMIEKIVKCTKDAPDNEEVKETNSEFRQSIRAIWETNKEKIKRKFPEIKHLNIAPENGYLFAVIEDEAFENMTVARLNAIKDHLYQSASAEDKKKILNECNFKVVFDKCFNYGVCNKNQIIV